MNLKANPFPQIEVSIAVLWEGPRDDPAQVRARQQVVNAMSEIVTQSQQWIEAASQLKRTTTTPMSP